MPSDKEIFQDWRTRQRERTLNTLERIKGEARRKTMNPVKSRGRRWFTIIIIGIVFGSLGGVVGGLTARWISCP
tara:strand:+ start:159 stop:380 length:222 start_codon:yes stop_codon:yes gene_type:complete